VRKSPMATALDLRQRRQEARLTLADMCEAMDVLNEPHVSAIEGGSRAITMERGIRAAHRVGPITVEVDGLMAAIVPVQRVPAAQTVMGPGDAGWVVREELQEATEALPRLEAAFLQRNRLGLVKAAEQVVSDVTHALSLLAGALDAFDVTIRRDADTRHRGKLARKLGADRDVCLFEVKQGG
jgi:transcriptional regulator with XRE-family HTH domain